MAEKLDIMFKILHKLTQLAPIRDAENGYIKPILLSTFLTCPHNYYNDNKSNMTFYYVLYRIFWAIIQFFSGKKGQPQPKI